MPMFEIEQYELHAQTFRVEAESEAEAIKRLLDGEAAPLDNSLELIEVANDFGLPLDEYRDLADELIRLGVRLPDEVIPSIRSITEIDGDRGE
jgi:hypothetical protein